MCCHNYIEQGICGFEGSEHTNEQTLKGFIEQSKPQEITSCTV